MAVKCQTVIDIMERMAPLNLAEDWDNVGLQVGDPAADTDRVLVTLDVNAEVVNEAITKNARMIVTHHPLIYQPLKNLRYDKPLGALIKVLVDNSIVVYCAHTNLDSAAAGVNEMLARKLGLTDINVLSPDKGEKLFKIVVFIPLGHEDRVREAISRAGAGWIGNYSECTFQITGTGTFRALAGANPFIGKVGKLERVEELRLETIVPDKWLSRVIKAMIETHPYEEVAYDVYPLANEGSRLGLGRIGKLPQPVSFDEFCRQVKSALAVDNVKIGGSLADRVHKIAVCGGSGAGLMSKAMAAGADVLVTGDLKYHDGQAGLAMGIKFIDAGHYATERVILGQVTEVIRQAAKETNMDIDVLISEVNTDPFGFF
jgi:dinuclear metal center YbgI/SA1388 family protein